MNYEIKHRKEICAWMRANGIDPKTVPIHSTARIVDRVIHYTVGTFVPSQGGWITEPATQPLIVEPGKVVRRWLMP